jgi:hypothetical protein
MVQPRALLVDPRGMSPTCEATQSHNFKSLFDFGWDVWFLLLIVLLEQTCGCFWWLARLLVTGDSLRGLIYHSSIALVQVAIADRSSQSLRWWKVSPFDRLLVVVLWTFLNPMLTPITNVMATLFVEKSPCLALPKALLGTFVDTYPPLYISHPLIRPKMLIFDNACNSHRYSPTISHSSPTPVSNWKATPTWHVNGMHKK